MVLTDDEAKMSQLEAVRWNGDGRFSKAIFEKERVESGQSE